MFKFGIAILLLCLATLLQAKPSPSKPTFCKGSKCPSFVVNKTTLRYEERKYVGSWWATTSVQVPGPNITSRVSRPCYWRLRGYLNAQKVHMGVPVTTTVQPDPATGKLNFTMSFYLPSPKPPTPLDSRVLLEYKPSLSVYVKVFKGLRFTDRIRKGRAQQLSNDLKSDGLAGKYYTPDVMYMTAGYDGPWVPRAQRTNEVWLVKKS